MAIELYTAQKSDEALLMNLMQKYLYELSGVYHPPMDDNGLYEYRWLPYYFGVPGRFAYLLREEGRMIGFALINTHSFTSDPVDHAIAEFTIFPAERGRGAAKAAVQQLFQLHPGEWQLKYSTRNTPAMHLWQKLTAPYKPREIGLEDDEVLVCFTVPKLT